MTARARITAEPWADSIAVYLVRDTQGVRLVERPNHPEGAVTVIPGTVAVPSLRLDDDMAVALLDALAAHYRRATDTGTLRADYEKERARVDRLTEALITAHAHAVGQTP